ncbi:MAG TPA: glycosyltransferase family 4 protein [Ktedonobacteraceae bacterium]
MRILMLTQFYPPLIGGEERHVRNLSIELAARGHEVVVATLWQAGLEKFEEDQGVRVYRIQGSMQRLNSLFKSDRRHAPPFADPETMLALRRLIIKERPQIVHAHNWLLHSFTPIKKWSKARLVVTIHDCSLVCAMQQFVYQGSECSGPALKKCLTCATETYGTAKGVPIALSLRTSGSLARQTVDMFLPVSKAVAQANQLARYNVPHQVIPNFIPDDANIQFDDAHPLLEQLPADGYLLFVGAIGRDKGAGVLLRAYAEMQSEVPLVLIGVPEAGFSVPVPPNARVLQSWPHAAVMSAWRRCGIALIPSICLDACPTVAMEAMAAGQVIVGSRIGGLPDIVVDGETGLLVPPGDTAALNAALQRLFADAPLRERMGKMAKERVAEFQASKVIPRIERVYQELLQPGQGAQPVATGDPLAV